MKIARSSCSSGPPSQGKGSRKKKLEKALAVDAGFPERDDAKALLEKIGNSG